MKVSQKDIANTLSLSRVTVTKALLGHPDIAEKTRKIVKDKAMELGYIPDFIGRSLSSRKTQTIGLVIPKIAHSFFAYTVERFYFYAKEKGYHLIPMVSFEDQVNESDNIQTLLSMRVDGIIIDVAENSESDEMYEFAKKSGCKILFFDRKLKGSDDSSVLSDDHKSAFKLTKLLISKGYKKIYHFAGPGVLSIASDRLGGFKEAAKEQRQAKIIQGSMTTESGYQSFKKLIETGDMPDAILAVNDSVAHGIYQAANEAGLRIPEDIAVAGFGDIESSRLLNPPLTTVKIPIDEMACYSIDLIIRMIEKGQHIKSQKVFNSSIIVRESI